MSKVWFITGAGSGLGASVAQAALAAGDRVIATGRNVEKVRRALDDVQNDNLTVMALNVADETQVEAAVNAAVLEFGRIDVLVNNAGYSLLGPFEELSTPDIEAQFATNFYGPLHLMRAALPTMRAQGSGHILNISSVAGEIGLAQCGAYGATKYALEGLSLSVAQELEPLGIKTTVVAPGFFRTDLLDPNNVRYTTSSVADAWAGFHGQQPGDPAKFGQVMVELANMENPPRQFLAGSDAVAMVQTDLEARLEAIRTNDTLSRSTDGTF